MLAVALCLLLPTALAAADDTLRIRLSWGGGAERIWKGTVAVSDGSLAEPLPLGIEADEPGSMWLEQRWLRIAQRSPRTYDGVELLVAASPEAKLLVQLYPANSPPPEKWLEVPLSELLEGSFRSDLDEQGNRLLVQRSPGDTLWVRFERRSLVFAPGEAFRFEVEPHRLAVQPGTRVKLRVQLLQGRGFADDSPPERPMLAKVQWGANRGAQEVWSGEYDAVAGEAGGVPVEARLPGQEGVYDVAITAVPAAALRLAPALRRNHILAHRTVQVLVLDDEPLPAPVGAAPLGPVGEEIDPANPKWWERFSKLPHKFPRLARMSKGPISHGDRRTRQHVLGPLVELGPAGSEGDVSWEACVLSASQPGRPHVLEVDYPSDVPQTLGISIIEPNAAGAMYPLGLDSGVEVSEDALGQRVPPHWARHRLVFWPRTRNPVLLLTNPRPQSPAVYGKIRVLAGWEHLPRAFPARGPRPERLLAAYLDRPLFPENFSASDAVGTLNALGIDDWATFHEGGTRLVEYLHYVGYNGLVLAAWADGSAIYPSALLEPTPRYDTGAFADAGQDPVRKDVLEMLFQLFDREGLQLIPALEFASPLPELEAILRQGGPDSQGIQWIGPQGTAWQQTYPAVRGMAPYYNVLHPRVQEAMLAVVRELVTRYGQHPSFGGVAIQLSAQGYAQLPSPEWGLDDITVGRFEQEMKIKVTADEPNPYAGRFQRLNRTHLRPWLEWRAARLSGFYRRVEAELAGVRPDARLVLAGADMFSGEQWRRAWQPALPQRNTVAEAMLRVGLDGRTLADDPALLVLRPERVSPGWSLARQAADLEIAHAADLNAACSELPGRGVLFFHAPQECRVASFDDRSPFQPAYTWLASQPVPSEAQNRRRFVESLADCDAQCIVDGGWQLPMGQEDSLRDLVAAYRRLPAIPFRPIADARGPIATQPVTIRYGSRSDGTYAYLASAAPFATSVRVQVVAPSGCRLDELSGTRRVAPLRRDAEGTYWSVDLDPYDLVAVRLSDPAATLVSARVAWAAEIDALLGQRIAELGDRAATLRNPPLLAVLDNPGFDLPASSGGQIAGWSTFAQPGAAVVLDAAVKHGGTQAAKIASPGPAVSLISRPFDPPATGRLTMSLWLRTGDERKQPPLRVAVEGKHQGRDFLRFAEIGRTQTAPGPVPRVDTAWNAVVVEVNDLPVEGLSPLRLRFDLTGAGEVWIDDVQLCGLSFSKDERMELYKLIAPAETKLQERAVGDCLRLLESYWPRYLTANVPLAQAAVTRKPQAPPPPAAAERPGPPRSAGMLDRLRNFLPETLRF